MAIYKLDVEQKYGQYRFRLYPKSDKPGEFASAANDVKGLVANLEEALDDLDLQPGADSVIFRNIEYDDATALRETVRFSKY